MKSLIRKIVRRRSKSRALRAARRNDHPVITKVIGSSTLPNSLVDTAHLSVLNYPADEDGMITKITLRLGGRAPGDGSDWEVRVYEKTNTRSFILKSKQSIHVSTKKTSEQTIRVHPPLNIRRGQYIGLVNKSGRLSLTYTRGWSTQRGGDAPNNIWDLWYLEEQPLQQLGSVTPQLLMWNGRVGWYATMAQDPPEPPMIVPVNTLQADMRKILEDITTTDVTFLIGPTYEPIHAHRCILKARGNYFQSLLSGGFIEEGKQTVEMIDTSPICFRLMLEWLYTNEIESLQPQEAVDVMQLAAKFCMTSLIYKCEQILKPVVDYDNVATLFSIAILCSANQLMAYCAYYARKYQVRLISMVSSENAENLHILASRARLTELESACLPYLSTYLCSKKNKSGEGEMKTSKNESKVEQREQREQQQREHSNFNTMLDGISNPPMTPPRGQPPPGSRERMWSA